MVQQVQASEAKVAERDEREPDWRELFRAVYQKHQPGQSHAQLAHHFAQLRTPLSTLGRQHPSKVACQLMRLY